METENGNGGAAPITSAAPIASNITEQAPANTSSAPVQPAAPVNPNPAPVAPANGEGTPAEGEQAPAGGENGGEGGSEDANAGIESPAAPVLNAQRLEELSKAQNYQPGEAEVDILDEFGNLDPAKFGAFMQQNNANVFEQALNAVNARGQAEKIERATWDGLRNEYADEFKANPNLDRLLRGARMQDVIAGGDGDLNRIAKEVVGPMRQNKIQAVEDVNRQVTEAEQLSAYKPNTAAPANTAAVPLMTQLHTALAAGDHATAQQIRHAIRKERIAGTSSNVNT